MGSEIENSDRPDMPGYGIQPIKEGAGLLPWSFVSERMTKARNYWVATVSFERRPHVSPVWGIWHTEKFYFGVGTRSRKGRNLKENPHLVVHLESGDDVVILEGLAESITDETLVAQLDKVYYEKYEVNLSLDDAFIYMLRVSKALAWREQDFPTSATRWQFKTNDTG